MIFEKKVFKVALFHTGHFEFCPTGKDHTHTIKITITAKNGLAGFMFDNIIPSQTDDILAFCEEFKHECESAKIEPISIEIYFNDIDISFIHFYDS